MYQEEQIKEMLDMVKINNHFELIDVLSSLDMYEFIPIKVGNYTIDLFYDSKLDKFSLFEDSHKEFKDLEEMSDYIQFYYL